MLSDPMAANHFLAHVSRQMGVEQQTLAPQELKVPQIHQQQYLNDFDQIRPSLTEKQNKLRYLGKSSDIQDYQSEQNDSYLGMHLPPVDRKSNNTGFGAMSPNNMSTNRDTSLPFGVSPRVSSYNQRTNREMVGNDFGINQQAAAFNLNNHNSFQSQMVYDQAQQILNAHKS